MRVFPTHRTVYCRLSRRLHCADAFPCSPTAATAQWSSSYEAACLPAPRLDVEGVGVLRNSDGGGGRLPYASPRRTRSAAASLPDRASLRPSVFRAPRRAPHPFLISIPSDRAVFRRTPVVAVVPPDLLPNRAAQPPLGSPLSLLPSPAGPGSPEFPAPTTRRWGSIWHLPRADPVPPTRASRPMP